MIAVFFPNLRQSELHPRIDHFDIQKGVFSPVSIGNSAGEGNRTLVCSLGSCRSAIELHPRAGRGEL